MNIFKALDRIFPCGADRTFGEVVSVTIDIGGWKLSEKRKAWYVNASVNAFHMHRSLVRQFLALSRAREYSFADERAVKRLIVACVLTSYLNNQRSGGQYHEYNFISPNSWNSSSPGWTAWWVCSDSDWREIWVSKSMPLQSEIDEAVQGFISLGRLSVSLDKALEDARKTPA